MPRQRLEQVPGVVVSVQEDPDSWQKPLQIAIQGDDIATLKQYARQLKAELYTVPGIVDLEAGMDHDLPEYRLVVDRERAAASGLGSGALANTVGVLVGGQAVTTYEDDEGEAVNVRVRLPEALRGDVRQVGDLKATVPTETGTALVPLSDLVTFTRATSPAEIGRRDLSRQVMVDANLDNLPLGTAGTLAMAAAERVELAPGYRLVLGGDTEIMVESFGYLAEALLLAIIFVYLILAAQFESFIDPLAIMLSLPLSIVGMAGMLWLTGDTINIMSLIGLIMLMGLVTKNAILLVDFTKVLRGRGLDRRDALDHRRAHAAAADPDDDDGDDLRHAAAVLRARRGGRVPGADGARGHRRPDHLDAADADRRAGRLHDPRRHRRVDLQAAARRGGGDGGDSARDGARAGRWTAHGAERAAVDQRGHRDGAGDRAAAGRAGAGPHPRRGALAIAAAQNRDIQKAIEYQKWVRGQVPRGAGGGAAAGELQRERPAAVRRQPEQAVQGLPAGGGSRAATPTSARSSAGARTCARPPFTVTQVVFTWGQVGAAVRAAKIGFAYGDHQLRRFRQAVARDVTTAFYDVLAARELACDRRGRGLDAEAAAPRGDERSGTSAGTATDYDVLAAQVAVENARPSVIRAQNLVRIGPRAAALPAGRDRPTSTWRARWHATVEPAAVVRRACSRRR